MADDKIEQRPDQGQAHNSMLDHDQLVNDLVGRMGVPLTDEGLERSDALVAQGHRRNAVALAKTVERIGSENFETAVSSMVDVHSGLVDRLAAIEGIETPEADRSEAWVIRALAQRVGGSGVGQRFTAEARPNALDILEGGQDFTEQARAAQESMAAEQFGIDLLQHKQRGGNISWMMYGTAAIQADFNRAASAHDGAERQLVDPSNAHRFLVEALLAPNPQSVDPRAAEMVTYVASRAMDLMAEVQAETPDWRP